MILQGAANLVDLLIELLKNVFISNCKISDMLMSDREVTCSFQLLKLTHNKCQLRDFSLRNVPFTNNSSILKLNMDIFYPSMRRNRMRNDGRKENPNSE
jgi:hypothetical protein